MRTIALATADGRCIASEVRIADSFLARSLGLLRRRSLDAHQGLLLMPGASVHTIGMRFAIDVVFLDRRMRILGLEPNVAPQRFCLAPPKTARVLELAAGRSAAVGLLIGSYLMIPDPADDASESTTTPLRTHVPEPCVRPPIQFSLRLPPQRCTRVHSDLACSTRRTAASVHESEVRT